MPRSCGGQCEDRREPQLGEYLDKIHALVNVKYISFCDGYLFLFIQLK